MGANHSAASKLYKKLLKEHASTNLLKFCWFAGSNLGEHAATNADDWSHVKAMIVDEEFAIIGSGNQDPQSWYKSREQNLLLDSPTVAKQILKELLANQQSLNNCRQDDIVGIPKGLLTQ